MMSEGWRDYKLGDLSERITSGGTPLTTKREYYGGRIPWLKTQEVKFNRIYETDTHITEEGLRNSSAKWISENSVIVAMYGATSGKVAICKIPLTTNQACCNITLNPKKANFNFIYYNLLSRYSEILNMATGAAQQNLNSGMLKELIIMMPDIQKQSQIAAILSSLDDKIELNLQMNKTLEAIAQAIFKEWFVDFRFPGFDGELVGGLPKGWRYDIIGNIGKVITGTTPSSTHPEHFGSYMPFITPTDFKLYSKLIYSSLRYLSKEGSMSLKNRILPKDSVIITCIGSDMGKVAINKVECLTNQQINSIVLGPKKSLTDFLYYSLLSRYTLLRNMATGGSTMPIINKSQFEGIEIIIPDYELLDKFQNMLDSINRRIGQNIAQNQTLSGLRDILLPKLMTGKIRVA